MSRSDWGLDRSDTHSSRWRRIANCLNHAKVVTVEPVLFLYVFAHYLYLIVFELYSFNRYGREKLKEQGMANLSSLDSGCITTRFLDTHGSNNKTGDEVHALTAQLNLIVGTAGQLPSIFASLILGPLSDRYGRKPALLVILVGAATQAGLVAAIVSFRMNLYFFALSAGIRASTGGMAGLLTSSYSYIADVSSKKWLTLRLGILESMTFIGGMLSLAIGGTWVQKSGCDFEYPVWLYLACVVMIIPYVIVIVPESLTVSERRQRTLNRPWGPKVLLRGVKIFFVSGYPRLKMWFALITMAIAIINCTGTLIVITLFLLHKPLEWKPYLIGLYMAASELMHGLALLIFLPIMVATGMPDAMIALVAILLGCAMNICMGFVARTWQMFVGKF